MEKRQFRFRRGYFSINGIYNIPGHIIYSGHGYHFETYCCKNCGELYVVDLEALHFQQTNLPVICKSKTCPICSDNLENCLLKYPENIFHNGNILKNTNPLSRLNGSEVNDLIEVFVLC